MILALVFILMFGLLVFVHEFGHFIVAKKLGVKVEEFGFGFPPRLFGIKRGETLYSINLIPLGGFVKLYGEAGEKGADPRSFSHLKVGQRVLILVAGVVMNIFLAVVLYVTLFLMGAPTFYFEEPTSQPGGTVVESFKIRVVQVQKDSPADKAGLKTWDELIAINSEELKSAKQLSETTRAHAGEEITLKIISEGQEKDLKIKLRAKEESEAPLGINPIGVERVSYPFPAALMNGLGQFMTVFKNIFVGLGDLIIGIFQRKKIAEAVSGPVGIGVLLNQFIKLGSSYVIDFAAFLSVTLAVFNILPIPALDGGKLPFLLIEKIRGRRVKPELENAVHAIGFAVLLLLIAVVTYSDIKRLISQ